MELKGVYPIVPTPFDRSGGLDLESVDRLTAFMVRREVDGLAVLGALGEGHKLNAGERSTIVARFRNGLPEDRGLVVGVRAAATNLAVEMAVDARRLGADAILLGPPPVQNDRALYTYYERVGNDAGLPVIIHDYPAATGITMAPELLARICTSVPNVRYIKLEDPPTGPKMDAVWALTGKDLRIFGALGGMYAFEELDRGAVGIMTGFAYPEFLVALYRRWAEGDIDGAAELFYDILPLNRWEFQPGIGVSLRKHVFVRRGVFTSACVRHPGAEADPQTLAHLFRIVDHLKRRGYAVSDD